MLNGLPVIGNEQGAFLLTYLETNNIMERLELKFDQEEGQSIVYEEHEDFEVVELEIVAVNRWSILKRVVVKRKDGLYFESSYSEGATEQQDESPYEYSPAVFKQVKPMEKTITYYDWEQ